MFPLSQRKLFHPVYSTCQGHINRGLSCAADYKAYYVELWCPFNGKIETYWGREGGNWLRLIRSNGDVLEFAHLSTYLKRKGSAKTGELLAYTGNTGAITTNPHLHVQIFVKGKRVDPEKYNWEDGLDVRALFRQVWKREGATGEINYFLKRLELGTIKPTLEDITEKMSYWYGIVYPQDKYSLIGDLRWQREKIKYI